MQEMRKWVDSWLGTLVGVTAGLLFLAAVTTGYAASEAKKPGQAVQQPTQGQQLCPATGGGPCKVVLDCPAIKSLGKTTCQATIDCPGTKQPVKTKKKSKSKSE
jgi:hypothetical protein